MREQINYADKKKKYGLLNFFKAAMVCMDCMFYMEDSECLSPSNIPMFL